MNAADAARDKRIAARARLPRIHVRCPACGQTSSVPTAGINARRWVTCPVCNHSFAVQAKKGGQENGG